MIKLFLNLIVCISLVSVSEGAATLTRPRSASVGAAGIMTVDWYKDKKTGLLCKAQTIRGHLTSFKTFRLHEKVVVPGSQLDLEQQAIKEIDAYSQTLKNGAPKRATLEALKREAKEKILINHTHKLYGVSAAVIFFATVAPLVVAAQRPVWPKKICYAATGASLVVSACLLLWGWRLRSAFNAEPEGRVAVLNSEVRFLLMASLLSVAFIQHYPAALKVDLNISLKKPSLQSLSTNLLPFACGALLLGVPLKTLCKRVGEWYRYDKQASQEFMAHSGNPRIELFREQSPADSDTLEPIPIGRISPQPIVEPSPMLDLQTRRSLEEANALAQQLRREQVIAVE